MGTPQEQEAVQLMRTALENPHGTSFERRQRLQKAWTFLRQSAVPTPASPQEGTLTVKKHHKKRKVTEDHRRVKKRKVKAQSDSRQVLTTEKFNEDKEKLLHEAAKVGDVERVVELLKDGVHISHKDNLGYSALHWASLYGHLHVVRALLGAGAGDGKRINRKTNSGNTSLHFACSGMHAEVAALLQLYKPDVYAVNECGQTPISLGLRKLVAGIEEEQRLAGIQALRNQSRLTLLVQEADFERQVNGGQQNNSKHDNTGLKVIALQKWESYQLQWSSFLQKYGCNNPGPSSPNDDSANGVIKFQDIPWPLTERKGSTDGEELILGLLHISGRDLHSLIQQERLRWHPDKFLQVFGSRLSDIHRDAILLGVNTVSQLLNSLSSEHSATSRDL